MEDVDGEHVIFIVVTEDVHVVAFGGGDALLFLELKDGTDPVTIASSALVLLLPRSLLHTATQRPNQIGLTAFEQKLNIAHRLLIRLRRSQILHAGAKTALDVILQTRPQMIAGEIDLAGRNQKAAV